jgi:hypothetical protein
VTGRAIVKEIAPDCHVSICVHYERGCKWPHSCDNISVSCGRHHVASSGNHLPDVTVVWVRGGRARKTRRCYVAHHLNYT